MPSKSNNSCNSRGSRSCKKKGTKATKVPIVETVPDGSATNTNTNNTPSGDDITIASSTLASVASNQMRDMFPPTLLPHTFSKGTLLSFLTDSVQLTEEIFIQLARLGITTPSAIGNYFGLSDTSIIQSFLQLGYHYIDQADSPNSHACVRLFMFGRSIILKKKMLPDEDLTDEQWYLLRKEAAFDKKFEGL